MMTLRILALAAPFAIGCAGTTSAPAPKTAEVACAGVSASERAAFTRATAVTPLLGKHETENRRWAFTRVIGAELTVPAESGASAERLQRVADCRAAEIVGARARVLPAGDAYAVQFTSDDPAVARELVSRANARTL